MPEPAGASEADVQSLLAGAVRAALAAVDPALADEDPLLRTADPRFGDFQSNAAIGLAKRLGRNPRELAGEIAERLGPALGEAAAIEVTGPGFVTFRLSDGLLGDCAAAALGDERLGHRLPEVQERVVVDYSHPNVAKEMHVGHLRSTIIGDALVRAFRFAGHEVVRQNHIGDWGTPFGMLIEHLLDLGEEKAAHELSVGDLNGFYRQARAKFDEDEAFAGRARARVVELQGGDPETLRLWRLLVDESTRYFDTVYQQLGVTLSRDDLAGESTYNPLLADVCAELERLGLARVDDGALCVFPEGFAGRDGSPQPLIIRNSVGGYTYATTDLAAIRHRLRSLSATRLVYVVGAPQAQHLAMVFQTAREAGWLAPLARAEHAAFGSVLGEDGRMYRTRAGDTVKLSELLDEAVERAAAVVAARSELSSDEQAAIARAVGIGAVKYADLANDRVKDYVFSWDRMLRFDGNTGPYMQYAHSRIQSILRNAADKGLSGGGGGAVEGPILPAHPAERDLVLKALLFGAVVDEVLDTLKPHKLCTYLLDVASAFTAFYENCPVLRAETPELVRSRLALTRLAGRVIAASLEILGIEPLERM